MQFWGPVRRLLPRAAVRTDMEGSWTDVQHLPPSKGTLSPFSPWWSGPRRRMSRQEAVGGWNEWADNMHW